VALTDILEGVPAGKAVESEYGILAAWLLQQEAAEVVMESTAQY
jgi:hypothetical protein